MEGLTRRALVGLAVLGGTVAASAAAGASTPDSLDALAKAGGFTAFGGAIDGGAPYDALSLNDAGVRAFHSRGCGILVVGNGIAAQQLSARRCRSPEEDYGS